MPRLQQGEDFKVFKVIRVVKDLKDPNDSNDLNDSIIIIQLTFTPAARAAWEAGRLQLPGFMHSSIKQEAA